MKFLKGYKFSANLDYEFDNEYFNPIDRFRYIEYDRDWSYNPIDSADQSADNIFNLGAKIEKDPSNLLEYKLIKRKRDIYIDGIQNVIAYSQSVGKLQLVSDLFILRNKTIDQYSDWNRANANIFYKSKIFVPGYMLMIDENELRTVYSDSVTGSAMNFREHLFYINSNDTLKTKFGLSYSIREDRRPVAGELRRGDASNTARFFINSTVNPNQRLNLLLTYRNNTNYQITGEPLDEETLIARADWYANFFKQHINRLC